MLQIHKDVLDSCGLLSIYRLWISRLILVGGDMRRLSQLAILGLISLCGSIVWGQATTSLRGTVTDPSGSAIHGARVTLVNSATSFSRETQTGTDGGYLFAEVIPGTYTLTVEAQGFSRYQEAGVVLQVQLPATANVRMKVGSISETVSVTAEAPPLNTTDSSLGNTMNTTDVENLPVPAENAVLLYSLQPGVTLTSDQNAYLTSTYDTRAGMVNGERSDQNNISLDGVSNNNEFQGYAFDGVLPITQFSVDEFRVTTSNYGVSQGRSSGAQISLDTKSGTNNFHGSLYEFNRNGVGEANEFFLKSSQIAGGLPNRPTQLVWNNYGGTIGGPILKNRLFFFFNYEGHRQNVGSSVERAIPSPTLQDGIIQYQCATASQCPGMSVTGASGKSYPIPGGYYALGPTQLAAMDPQHIGPSKGALAYFATYPTANDLSYSDAPNYAGYRFAAPTTTRENWMIGRLDYKITQNGNHTLFFRGTGVDSHYNNAPFLPGRPPETTSLALSKGFVAGYTSLWGPHVVNNLRYGLTRESVGVSGDSNAPWVQMRDLDQDIAYSYGDTAPVHNIADTVDWNKGTHSLEFGINFLLSRLKTYNYGQNFSDALTNADWIAEGGFANENDFLNPACNAQNAGSKSCTPGDNFPAVSSGFAHTYDFPLAALMGIESEVDGVFNYKIGASGGSEIGQNQPINRHWAVDNYNFFFGDTWKVRPSLTLTYGLNYQLMTPMTETAGQEVTPNVNIGQWFNQRQSYMYKGIPDNRVNGGALVGFSPAGSPYGKPGLYSAQTKNFAPRLGIAWAPHADSGWLHTLFGQDKTSIRAGAGMYYQNFGPELAQFYSGSGEFGVSTVATNPAHRLALANSPRIGGSLSDMNNIPLNLLSQFKVLPPSSISFPQAPTAGSLGISDGIDQSMKTPYSYALDLSIERQLPGRVTLDIAYVGHFSHRLLVLDDVAEPTNLVDPKSGISYFQAARQLSKLWRQNTPENGISASTIGPTAQYWQDMLQASTTGTYTLCSSGASTTSLLQAVYDVFGQCGDLYNETSALYDIDTGGFPATPVGGLYSYYNSQWSSLWDWRSIAWSNYNALQVSLNKQMSNGVMFGFNYTYSHALDIESMSERATHYLTNSVINAWSPQQMYGPGDADLRHQINGYWVVNLPFGHGQALAATAHGALDAVIGGWRLGGTTRWTSGFPVSVFQGYVWPTNWDEMGWSDLTGAPIPTGTTITNGNPSIFKNVAQASKGFDYAYPGESGVRNAIRGDGYMATDLNLAKTFKIPHTESHSFELRWSVFNAFNNVKFDAFSMQDEWDVPTTFGDYTSTLTSPRRMEFAGIYRF